MIKEICRPEDRCQRSETILQTVLRAIPVPVSITRAADGKFLYANEHHRSTFGLPIEGSIDLKTPEMYCHPEDRGKLLAELENNKYLANFEVELKKIDGTTLWAAVSAEYLTYEGEPALFCAFHDITERKRGEERARQLAEELERRVCARTAALEKSNEELRRARDDLQQANERFSLITQWIPVPIAITRKATGKVIYANDHMAALFGLTHGSELHGRAMTDFFFDPADRSTMLQKLERQGYLCNYELCYKKADGTPLWAAAHFRYFTYDGGPAVFGAVVDNSEDKQRLLDLQQSVRERADRLEKAYAELKKSNEDLTTANELFRIIAQFLPVPIAITHKADGKVIYANDQFAKVYGLMHSSDLLGREMASFYHDPADRLQMVRILERQGYLSNYELRCRKTDGTPFWAEVHFQYLNYNGQEAVFGVLLDITERKQLSEQLKQHSEELELRVRERTAELEVACDRALAADKAKDIFVASVSHELRTPLNSVLGFCQLLEGTSLNGQQQEDLRKILRSGDHLKSLIDDILEYQKILVDGQFPMDLEDFETLPLLTEVTNSMEAKIREKGNRLEIDCAPDLGHVRCDRKRFVQILTNLLSNAAKFTKEGSVVVTAGRERGEHSDRVVVSVADSGKGIDPENASKLFKPLGIPIDRRDNPEGTGLGLAISKKLCEKMGGDIGVTTALGKGTTFTFRLPAGNAPETTSARSCRPPVPLEQAASLPTTRPCSVLVIDDDPEVGELMKRFLEKQGFVIHVALTGGQALDKVKTLRPAIVTLDVLMPEVDGWGVLAALKNDAEIADIPVIIVSIVDDRSKGFMLGATDYVTKPVKWERLAALLRKYCAATEGGILVVDDDANWREVCRRTLEHSGWKVAEADDGASALRLLVEHRPSLILLDLMLPVMDGFAFLQRVRSQPEWQGIPIVVMTAKELTEQDRRRLNGAVQDILEKGRRNVNDLLEDVLRDVRRYVLPSP